MFSEVNFIILSRELRQLPTNDKKGYSEPILRITDRAMSSQQVVIHNTAGDSYELFPTCHSLCSAASVCPSNCSPVDFTLAPTAGFLADLPGRFLLAIICGHFGERERASIFQRESRNRYHSIQKAGSNTGSKTLLHKSHCFHVWSLIWRNVLLSVVLC